MAVGATETDLGQQQVGAFADRVRAIRTALHEVVVGQDEVIDQLLVCAPDRLACLDGGRAGFGEDADGQGPGRRRSAGSTRRIQFTPDLMPADVTGYELLGRGEDGQGPAMTFRPGPVFANLVLADEINRAAPKTQSALLEAMAERHVTVGGKTYPLEEPFLVAATQNPIEQEGTYPLPEAQLDRFMMEIRIGYPTPAQEEEIVMRTTAGDAGVAGRRRWTARSSCSFATWCWPCRWPRTWPATRCGSAGRAGRRTRASGKFVTRLRGLGRRPAGLAEPGAGGEGPGACWWAAPPRLPKTSGPSALPILRHRIIVNHRAVGDSVTSADIDRPPAGRSGRMTRPSHQPVPRSAGAGGAGAHAFHHAPPRRRDVHGLATPRGSWAGRASSSISASTPAAKTCGGSIGRCWPAPARPSSASTRRRRICAAPLAIDASGSMRFGLAPKGQSHFRWHENRDSPAGSKLEYVQYLTTALSHVISRGQDQVGLAVLNGRCGEWLAPGATASHVEQLQRSIEAIETRPSLRMAAGLRDLFERCRRRGALMLLSDFLMEDLEEVFAGLRLFRHRGWDIVVLHLVHPDEERLPQGVAFRFEGMEDDGRVNCSPAEIAAAYRERFAAHLAMVRQLALAGGCDYRRVSTAIPYLQTLGGFLVERAG